MRPDYNISHKANRVLNIILLAFLLIFIRVWYLGYVQHDEHVLKALKPQRKTVVDKVERATIRDRFNIPMATNTTQYNAAVRYADLRQIPSGVWKKDKEGKKYREPVRNNYIQSLSQKLGSELRIDPVVIEDTIHAKACLFPHTPFVIKEDLSEEEFFRLKLLEKDWIGIEAQKATKRVYPLGKVGCDIIGYMGSISQNDYVKIAEEIKTLQHYIEKRDRGELAILPAGFECPLDVRARLKELQEKSYTINDQVGRAGIEYVYEEVLRGLHGKKIYEVDPKGNTIRSLACSKASSSGQRVLLTISSELQEYAEALLAQNEEVRQTRDTRRMIGVARPWILGGAIVAMDPNSGDILAMASYPRFDPNDFIPSKLSDKKKEKQSAVIKWLENESFVGEIWDGIRPLERERYSLQEGKFYTQKKDLSWSFYLDTILPPDSTIRAAIDTVATVGCAHQIVMSMKHLMTITETSDVRALVQCLYDDAPNLAVRKNILPEQKDLIKTKIQDHFDEVISHKSYLDRYIKDIQHNDDKVLLMDLCRLVIPFDFEEATIPSEWKDFPLSIMHEMTQTMNCMKTCLQEEMQKIHHEEDFEKWRKEYFKEYLKIKRKEEKENKKYTKPYTEYLEKVEKALFKEFWNACHPIFIDTLIHGKARVDIEEYPQLSPYIEKLSTIHQKNIQLQSYTTKLQPFFRGLAPAAALKQIKNIKSFSENSSLLWGKYRMLRNTKGEQQLKHLAGAFYPLSGFGFGRSQAFRQAAAQGSVFKLVVAYEAMREKYHYLTENQRPLSDINPLTLIDELRAERAGTNHQILGYTIEGDPIKRLFKGGRLPRSHPNIGKIDVRGALEQSSNLYFSYLSAEHIQDPSLLDQAARNMGYGAKTGIELPGEIAGNIPSDINDNKTGLYSFAIGQHSLVVTPLQTSVMLSSIASQGKVYKPKIVQLTAGKKANEDPFQNSYEGFPFQDALSLGGIQFPLFTEAVTSKQEDKILWKPTEIHRELFFPDEIRWMLLEGMQRVINGNKGTARPNVIRALWHHPKTLKDYLDLRYQLVGKTGTAETLYKQWIDAQSQAEISNNIWFGGICFSHDESGNTLWDKPEIVIAVYLRFSDTGGKEAAPLAAQVAAKWRELCQKHGKTSHVKWLKEEQDFSDAENMQW
jgi:cell division protein FtsI/penicillin-binding protein 2